VGLEVVFRAYPGLGVATEDAFVNEDVLWRLGWVGVCGLAELIFRR
jgi:hypothetical protein